MILSTVIWLVELPAVAEPPRQCEAPSTEFEVRRS
jgi:hypothetical protein